MNRFVILDSSLMDFAFRVYFTIFLIAWIRVQYEINSTSNNLAIYNGKASNCTRQSQVLIPLTTIDF